MVKEITSHCVIASEACTNIPYRDVKFSPNEFACFPCQKSYDKKNPFQYTKWEAKVSANSYLHLTKRCYYYHHTAPIYLKCVKCSKYRSTRNTYNIGNRLLESFTCDDCDEPEDKMISEAIRNKSYLKNMTVPLLTRSSPVFPIVEHHFCYPELGLDVVTDPDNEYIEEVHVEKKFKLKESPFYLEDENETGTTIRPDKMSSDELVHFPEFHREERMFLGLRNIIVTVWFMNKWVPVDMKLVEQHYIVPGLARAHMIENWLEKIARFLSVYGIINHGILPRSIPYKVKTNVKVAIIGAGMSGLSCARALYFHGIDSQIFEAKDRIGGRVDDDFSLGVAVGKGAQILTGYRSNPVYTLMEHAGVSFFPANDGCPLIDVENGNVVPRLTDLLIDNYKEIVHTNAKIAADEMRGRRDCSVIDIYEKVHSVQKNVILHWNKDYERLYQFHLGNLEFACGASLQNVSGRHFDQNEDLCQHSGAHLVIDGGVSKLIDAMAASNPNIHLNSKLTHVNYKGSKVLLKFENGREECFDKVVFTLSNYVMANNPPTFVPELPKQKVRSYKKLGCGLIEKVAAQFTEPFWDDLTENEQLQFFGHVPSDDSTRKLFNIIYNFSSEDKYVLMSYFAADAAHMVSDQTEEYKVEMFVNTLKAMFPQKNVEMIKGFATNWAADSEIGMSYSYIPVGSTGKVYDHTSAAVDNKLFFAGEGTVRYFPQTITGAYISGQREAAKIMISAMK